MLLKNIIRRTWKKISRFFQPVNNTAPASSAPLQTTGPTVVDASSEIKALMVLADNKDFTPAIEAELNASWAKLVNVDYKKLGIEDGKKCTVRPIEASARANASALVSPLTAGLAQWEIAACAEYARAKEAQKHLQEELTDLGGEVQLHEQYSTEFPRHFSTFRRAKYMGFTLGMLLGEGAMIYFAVTALGIGDDSIVGRLLQFSCALAITCSMIIMQIFCDEFIGRPDEQRANDLSKLRWKLKGEGEEYPKRKSFTRLRLFGLLFILLLCQLVAVGCFSYVRAHKHGLDDMSNIKMESLEDENRGVAMGAARQDGAPVKMVAKDAREITSEERLAWARFLAFLLFSLLFATLSGVCLSYGLQIHNNLKLLAKLQQRIAVLREGLEQAASVIETFERRLSQIVAMRARFGPERIIEMGQAFTDAYRDGWRQSMGDHERKTPLLMKHQFKRKL
jgi:hypothetical protein